MANRLQIILSALLLVSSVVSCGPPSPVPVASRPAKPDPDAARRGHILLDAANCAECHTDGAHGGEPLAGGKAIPTAFGTFYSRNITPDPVHGIGAWTDADFLRALRDGISPDGAHYYPAFPFTSFTLMTDRDILDLRAYLATLPPSTRANRANDVAFPFDMRLMMVPWRWFNFERGPYIPDPTQSAEWNRGAYLANGVAHCGECHTPRDWLGALEQHRRFAGAKIPGVSLPAPNISSDPKDGIGAWNIDDVVTLLTSGQTRDGDVVSPPMADVVAGTAKLSETDRHAIAVYVKSVPPQ